MQGGDVFKLAVKSMADAAEEALARPDWASTTSR